MGKNICLQMLDKRYVVTAYNRSPEPLKEVTDKGAKPAKSLKDLVGGLQNHPKVIWVMLTSGEATTNIIHELSEYCNEGDIIIDGSNSFYKNSIALHENLKKKGVAYLDAGCSGGPSGALKGMSIMVGGDKEVFEKVENIFRDLSVSNGYLYVGKSGSGHFTKMVHNAIEYGMMQSLGEGLELIENGPYKNVDLAKLCKLWNNGSVIRGYLIELAARAMEKDPHLKDIAPYVEDSGEGRWAVSEAIDNNVPFSTISYSLFARIDSRSEKKFQKRVLAALRQEFGGHAVKKG
ncbi:MAG: decarboxylating 6-phosphogluconate dehydrogenase [Candidatus Micrarchaeota archaeon]|nr:decarboxylating 6-phosphogluconate dehydrogenase [Candidatus Micrarchaeota archaeon]